MKLFGPLKDVRGGRKGVEARLDEIDARLTRIEQVLSDLKPNMKMLPAIVRRLYLEGVELPPPYDLTAQRFRLRSQNEEDGLLLALFKRIGMTDRRAVEIGCGTNGGNSGFLVAECGWKALMIDANRRSIANVQARYAGHDVVALKRRASRENIDPTLVEYGFTGDIDLLSIDIDGNDFWVWDAVSACSARVVLLEYNWLFGPDRAVTIPYDPEFTIGKGGNRGYRGASLEALVRLGRRKGYRLIATERVNAFFLRNDLAPEVPAIDSARGYRAPNNLPEGKDLFGKIERAGLPLVTISETGLAE